MADQPRTGDDAPSGGPNPRRRVPFSVAQARRELQEAERNLRDLQKRKVTGPMLDQAKDAVREARKTLERLTSGSRDDRRDARQDFMGEYYNELGGPWIAELVKRDPELRRLLEKAIRNDDVDGFLDDLYQSDWWNDPKRSGSWKNAFRLEFAKDKTEWNDSLRDARDIIKRTAKSVYGIDVPEDMLDTLARRYMYQGWGDREGEGLRAWLADAVARGWIGKKPEDESQIGFDLGGSALLESKTWRDRARAYGLDYSDSWAEDTIKKILDPNSGFTEDDAWNQILSDAEGLYPVFQGKLSKDRSVRDVAAGYIGQLARYLEINDPELIDLADPLLQKAFTNLDQNSNPSLMPLWQFTQEIKKDGRWQYTSNALDTYSRIGSDLSRMMGFVG